MNRKKIRFPPYTSVIGDGTQIRGALGFSGGLHVDGHIAGDVTGDAGGDDGHGSAMTVAASGVIEGNLNVPFVVIDGTVIGDVRATLRAVLASGARIQGTVYYGALEMDEGATVNGRLVHIPIPEASHATDAAKAPPQIGTSDPDVRSDGCSVDRGSDPARSNDGST